MGQKLLLLFRFHFLWDPDPKRVCSHPPSSPYTKRDTTPLGDPKGTPCPRRRREVETKGGESRKSVRRLFVFGSTGRPPVVRVVQVPLPSLTRGQEVRAPPPRVPVCRLRRNGACARTKQEGTTVDGMDTGPPTLTLLLVLSKAPSCLLSSPNPRHNTFVFISDPGSVGCDFPRRLADMNTTPHSTLDHLHLSVSSLREKENLKK